MKIKKFYCRRVVFKYVQHYIWSHVTPPHSIWICAKMNSLTESLGWHSRTTRTHTSTPCIHLQLNLVFLQGKYMYTASRCIHYNIHNRIASQFMHEVKASWYLMLYLCTLYSSKAVHWVQKGECRNHKRTAICHSI